MNTLRETWHGMSKEEQIEATRDAVEEVQQMREMKQNAVHNVAICAFHDVQANVKSIEHQVRAKLNSTGIFY